MHNPTPFKPFKTPWEELTVRDLIYYAWRKQKRTRLERALLDRLERAVEEMDDLIREVEALTQRLQERRP